VASGDPEKARDALGELAERAASPGVLEARVEVARATADAAELGAALTELARVSPEEARSRSEMLVEAAQAAARAGDTEASLARAREAARLSPDVASTQLFARGLEYRLRGAGTVAEAKETIEALERLSTEGLEPEDVGLRAFLHAEAEDVVSPGAGERTLLACQESVGAVPLVSLALAERAAAAGRHADAARAYEQAVYGNLLGLRRPGRVALAAADSAERAGDRDAAMAFLDEAVVDPETRVSAMRRLTPLAIATGDLARARSVLRKLADLVGGEERAELLADLARALLGSTNPAERLEGDRTMRDAADAAPPELAARLRAELGGYRSRASGPLSGEATLASAPPASPVPAAPAAPPPLPEKALAPVASAPASAPLDPIEARIAEARAKLAAGEREEGERLLSEALRDGSTAAADALDEILSGDGTRSGDLLKVRQKAVELCPGDLVRLGRLREAARADQNYNYVRAIEHVLRAFDPGQGPLPPPPLSAQSAQPGMMSHLTAPSRERAGEVFGVLWEAAPSLFAKPNAAYGMAGLDRIMPGDDAPLSRLYEVALRLLDRSRFPLFHRPGDAPLTLTLALLSSPAAILSGDAKGDGPVVRWMLGRAMSAVLPANALPLGLPERDGIALWQVLAGAFGPPGAAPFDRAHALLADTLWQTLPPRAQRRLKELLEDGDDTPFEHAVRRATQSGRRVGMFLTGDFGHAARTTLAEYGGSSADELTRPGGLERLCKESDALADLYRLAVCPEYADARWHVPTPTSQRFSLTGGVTPL
jgi:cellulose synthase operon protein C